MKLMHLSDLHLGKKLGNYSLLEKDKNQMSDQEIILLRILAVADDQKPDCVLIAGDVFDKSVPAESAVTLFDWFLGELAKRRLPTLIISGNHDSDERLAYGRVFLEQSQIYISPVFDGTVQHVTLSDADGEVCFWLLPFLRPAMVREKFPDVKIDSYDTAFGTVVQSLGIDPDKRNVLIAHQYVSGAVLSPDSSEEIYVGTVENISISHLEAFDYVALGHLHTPQNVGGSERIRYCGTPLKYSYAERLVDKSVTIVELGAKGTPLTVSEIPLHPKRDLREVRGSYEELIAAPPTDDFVYILLTDEEPIPNVQANLRTRYSRILSIDYVQRKKEQTNTEEVYSSAVQKRSPFEIFAEFYRKSSSAELTEEQSAYMNALIQEIWEEEEQDETAET